MRRSASSLILFLFLLLAACLPLAAQDFAAERRRMVETQIEARGIGDERVLDAMRRVERHLFVPADMRGRAYTDSPLPIGEGQTISQPYIVALMTETLRLSGSEKVLEVGTGSGYQAAVLSLLAKEVCTVEIRPGLQKRGAELLASLGLRNVAARQADGYDGWAEKAPFDCIMITAAVNHVPPPLLRQLKDGGRMVLPLGNPFAYQDLVLVTRTGGTYTVDHVLGVLFVPMTGKALGAQPSKE
jgi:protein-L-isoaspartate(D-aspartate) O-methyltransferase